MKALNGRLSVDGSAQAHRHGGHSGAVTPKSFPPPHFVVLRKNCFKHMIKKPSPLKIYFLPKTLKPGYRPVSGKTVSAFWTYLLKAIRPRDVA